MLVHRLAVEQSGAVRDLQLRAARWFAAHGEPTEAIRHAVRAGTATRRNLRTGRHYRVIATNLVGGQLWTGDLDAAETNLSAAETHARKMGMELAERNAQTHLALLDGLHAGCGAPTGNRRAAGPRPPRPGIRTPSAARLRRPRAHPPGPEPTRPRPHGHRHRPRPGLPPCVGNRRRRPRRAPLGYRSHPSIRNPVERRTATRHPPGNARPLLRGDPGRGAARRRRPRSAIAALDTAPVDDGLPKASRPVHARAHLAAGRPQAALDRDAEGIGNRRGPLSLRQHLQIPPPVDLHKLDVATRREAVDRARPDYRCAARWLRRPFHPSAMRSVPTVRSTVQLGFRAGSSSSPPHRCGSQVVPGRH
jgi:hypothetical protein